MNLGIKGTPAVRALAKRLNVDLSLIIPSSKNGIISSQDVERAKQTPLLPRPRLLFLEWGK